MLRPAALLNGSSRQPHRGAPNLPLCPEAPHPPPRQRLPNHPPPLGKKPRPPRQRRHVLQRAPGTHSIAATITVAITATAAGPRPAAAAFLASGSRSWAASERHPAGLRDGAGRYLPLRLRALRAA